MLYGYIVVLNPKPFAIFNSSILVETNNSTVLANENGLKHNYVPFFLYITFS